MPSGPSIKFGTYKVAEKRIVTRTFECAAWSETIEIEAGVFDAKGQFDGGRLYWGGASIPGVIVDAHFPAVFGGVQYANKNEKQDVGQSTTYSFGNVYGYNIARDIVERPYKTAWSLDPGFRVEEAGYDNTVHIYRTDHSKFTVKRPAYRIVKEAE